MMENELIPSLIELSHQYGGNADFVLAGGGNTSAKNEDTLWIKGSGVALAVIEESGFVKMCRKALNEMFEKNYGTDETEREAKVLADLMAAKLPGEQAKRPSVETMLHNLFPQKYVLHVHPAFVNALTCAEKGKEIIGRLFPEAVWIPACKPGYILSMICYRELAEYKKRTGQDAGLLFLENHGVFFAADSKEEIDALVVKVRSAIEKVCQLPDVSHKAGMESAAANIIPTVRMLYRKYEQADSAFATYFAPAAFFENVQGKNDFRLFAYPPTPDHIVYCKARPLYVEQENPSMQDLDQLFASFMGENGYVPKIVAVQGMGIFALGRTKKEADTAKELFTDELKVVYGAQITGAYHPMTQELTDFIVHWEVESYRSKASLEAGGTKRLSGKIALVTGSAQGFGKGIAERLAQEGAVCVIADMNAAGAEQVAQELNVRYGKGTAMAVGANVSDEQSVKEMFEKTALFYGGLDIYINNAGIVRAGSLAEMDKKNFELVTAVNYTAYFLCVKYASQIMKAQTAVLPAEMTDIIEINSKSGLSGSNKNFAYAGSKFGGIGLTQSFALELAPYSIKVNAVCPGNFLNGPLWSDPEKGLFVQYLHAGKVPGARTVEDVRKFYESKVPLGRGCETEDVVRAILYSIEQKYETGQAIPVTGGQEMLK